MSTTDETSTTTTTILRVDEVVIGWKPGEGETSALEWTLQRIERLQAILTLLAAVPRESDVPAAQAELDAAAADIRQRARVIPQTRVVVGDPAKELAALTADHVVVVVGTDRRRGLTARYSFSLGTRLAARAHGPVALIPRGDLPTAAGVVVGVDGTPASLRAARVAAKIAGSRREGLTAVHVWQEPTPWQDAYLPPDDSFIESMQRVHQDVLDESVAAFTADFPDLPVTRKLVHGLAPWGLLDQARGASLLVVGNHGLRGIQRFLLGSVSHTVVLNLEGPTVVVPQR